MTVKPPCPRCGSFIFFRNNYCQQCGYLSTAAAQLISTVLEVERVDPIALYEWALPLAEELGAEFSCSGWPRADLDMWLRKRYLAARIEQPSSAPATPSCVDSSQAAEPATGSVLSDWFYSLAKKVLL